ncbi:MAG TPA: multiubiquitin domain-containing protein [Acidimicrobiales bacterium]
MSKSDQDKGGQPPVTFTLDGVEHTSPDRRLTASEVLQKFGNLNPADYDLVRVVGQGNDQRLHDNDEVQLVPGGRYVSLFTGSMPVE